MSHQPPVSAHAAPQLPPHQPGTPPESHQPGTSSEPARGAASLDIGRLWAGAAVSVASYIAVLIFSLALMVLTLAGIAAGQGTLVPALDGALPAQETPDAWSQLGQLTAQLVAMAHLGTIDTVVQGALPFFGTIRGEGLAHAVPVTLLLASVLCVYFGSRLAERRIPSAGRPQLLLQSVVTGVVYSLLINGVAAAAAVRFPVTDAFTVEPISAEDPWSAFVAFLLGAGVSAVSRNSVLARRTPPVHPVRLLGILNLPLAAVAVHASLFALAAVPAAWITAAVSGGWTALLSGPLWIGNAVGYSLVTGHLGGLRVLVETSQILGGQESRSEDHTVYGFGADVAGSAVAGVAWAALVLALACTLATGIAVLVRRGQVASSNLLSWIPVPAGFLVLGLLLMPLLTAQAGFDVPGLAAGQYLLAPAWWSPVVFLAWGLLVEVCARFLAPHLLPLMPAGLQRLVRAFPPAPAPAASPSGPASSGSASSGGEVALATASGNGTGIGSAPPPAPARELSAGGKKHALVALAVVGSVIVLAVGSVVAVNAVKAGPDKLVGEYVQALVDGDAEKALAILDPDIPNEERSLLTNEVYGAAENRIEGFSVLSSKVSGDSAVVHVELRQGGRRHEQAFSLYKNRPEFLDDHWKLGTIPLQRVAISADAAVPTLAINGVAVPTGQEDPNAFATYFSVPAFPGSYSVGLPEGEKYLAAAQQEVLVAIGSAPQSADDAKLTVTASEQLRAETSRQVDAALAACAKSTEMDPQGCPFSRFAFGDVRNVKWSITSEPDYTMQRSFDGTWRLSGGTPGEASVAYERNASFSKTSPEWEKETDQMDFYVRGTVSIASDKVQVKLSAY
ncbi:hypothetical protein [Arthrobacter pascens]|uniref:hypothetical protein n=1 Tax=Arthrobacter pascens TaxID=1677 RepID=UPI00196AD33F|nr:hypothetical protein [Arthrobacter pascens]MBN3499477.1 hypothetical protein [Arthrobacter pascens]